MKSKTVLITGGNSGLGLASARKLAKMGARIILVARNQESGKSALDMLHEENPLEDHRLYLCDQSSLKQVNSLCNKLNQDLSTLDVLINNAGIITRNRQLSEEGFEYQFAVNHLSHFLLTQRLVALLRASKQGRIINVSSAAHAMGKIHYQNINLENNYSPFRAYAQSKLANVLFTYGLCSRLFKEGITANAVHPGLVGTRFGAGRNGNPTNLGIKFYQKIAKPPEKGAETIIYLASAPELSKQSGGYFVNRKARTSAKESYDPDAASALWEISLDMVGLEQSLI